jgi:drug efflux transport system ATP-binding protein
MIKFDRISKSYGDTEALNEISLEVRENELFGLIGPDGAGKSSLFRILTTVLLPDDGKVFFDGRDIEKETAYVRENVGYMPGKFSLYQDLSVRENLEFFATIFNTSVEENYSLIKDIYQQLESFESRKAGALSGGMKQKLALSCALIHKPKVLVLDEPTFGVDAVSRKEFWDILYTLREKGVTILVSTPYMDEAELCDRVALIQKGRIMKIDKPEGIIKNFDKSLISITTNQIHKTLQILEANPQYGSAYSFGREVHLYSEKTLDLIEIEKLLNSNDLELSKVELGVPNIEDCFMNLMSKEELFENGE